jgi:uncharacterized protein
VSVQDPAAAEPSAQALAGAQMGRPLDGQSEVASRCDLGLPVVLRVAPLLPDGRPFPTLYYLTCPLARARVSRLEEAGGVREMTAEVAADPDLSRAQQEAAAAYAAEREALVPAGDPHASRVRGGVAGATGAGLKCLHAHYAHARAGRRNPVGERVREQVEPLDCSLPCVGADPQDPSRARRLPSWREPRKG